MDDAPQTNRTDEFKLPGYTSTFYLNDPIIPGGHFYWREALHNGDRIPQSKAHVENILTLARRLEGVRQTLSGLPITVTSWYRPEPWNSQVGGARKSRHLTGEAVDFIHPVFDGRQMASRLQDWNGGMGIYPRYPKMIHLDIRPYHARWGGA